MKKIKKAFIGIVLICAFALNFSIFTDTNIFMNKANAQNPPRRDWGYTSFYQTPIVTEWIAFEAGDCWLKNGSNFNGWYPCYAWFY